MLQANILVLNLQPIFKQPQNMSEHIPRHVLKTADLSILWKRRNVRENATRTETSIVHFLLFHHKNVTNKILYVQNKSYIYRTSFDGSAVQHKQQYCLFKKHKMYFHITESFERAILHASPACYLLYWAKLELV